MRLSPFSLSATKMPSDTSGMPRARTSCARSRQHGRRWPAMRPPSVKLFMRHYTSLHWTHNRTCGFPCIRLSDKTSRLRPRHIAPKPGQTHEPEGLVEVRKWIAAALAPSGLVLEAQPPTQPHRCVAIERAIGLG